MKILTKNFNGINYFVLIRTIYKFRTIVFVPQDGNWSG